MPVTPSGPEAVFHAGIEDLILLPLVIAAALARRLLQLLVWMLVPALDFAFVLAMEVTRIPLFVLKALGDGTVAAVEGLVSWLPVSEANRREWHDAIGRKWALIRQTISYRAFEDAIHRAFERGMEWVFTKCRRLSPRAAVYVIAAAVLWLPISFGAATAMHALLLAYAVVLPPWMQLLHPFATLIAKSKLLVLPVYPAAWPQAKKDPAVQKIATGYRNLEGTFLIQKMEHRYCEMQRGFARAGDVAMRVAASTGMIQAWAWLSGASVRMVMRTGAAMHAAMGNALKRLSQAPLIGPIANRWLYDFERVKPPHVKASERLRRAFDKWAIKFSAEYYEAKEREEAAKAASAKMLGGSASSASS
jgi:hypothetical protein